MRSRLLRTLVLVFLGTPGSGGLAAQARATSDSARARPAAPVVNDAATILAGFAFAHAAWSASDLPRGELVVPLAFVQKGAERELVRFEAPTQEKAVAGGKAAMADARSHSDAWAFAREGLFPREGKKVDVLVVDCWAKGMSAPATFVQQFEPYAARQRFRIVGEPLLMLDGEAQGATLTLPVLEKLREGIHSHPMVGSLWGSWQ